MWTIRDNLCNLWITMLKMFEISFVACFKDAFCYNFPQKKSPSCRSVMDFFFETSLNPLNILGLQ